MGGSDLWGWRGGGGALKGGAGYEARDGVWGVHADVG